MADKHVLSAQSRDLKVKNRKYRRDGMIVANIYGEGESQAVVVVGKEFHKLLPQVSESTVIYLTVGKDKEIPVMISEVQRDSVSGGIIHVALRQVNLREKVMATIPIEAVGEFSVPEAVFLLVRDEIEAEALPTDLPEKFVVDVSHFTEVGEQFSLADLVYDREKIKLQVEDENEPVVVVNAVKEEVAEAVVETGEQTTTEGVSGQEEKKETEEHKE
jgi:large subunit ribosomal protein L25